jgi:HK97 family phage major capsid protein
VKHTSQRAMIAGAIELKGDDENPVEVVNKALADLAKTVDERLAKVEGGAEIKALLTRIDDLEKKANRPGGKPDEKEAANLELKALASLLRSGNMSGIEEAGGSIEAKSAASSDNDAAGGYFVLPTVDLTIRTLMTDLSVLRSLAEVVSISTDKYERFYSMGKRGAQWVAERDDRPQDTPRPDLIKHSYSVSELYAAPVTTRHLLDDAATDIASWLINNAVHDFDETEGEAFWTGDGVEGKPRGLLDYGTAPEKASVHCRGPRLSAD